MRILLMLLSRSLVTLAASTSVCIGAPAKVPSEFAKYKVLSVEKLFINCRNDKLQSTGQRVATDYCIIKLHDVELNKDVRATAKLRDCNHKVGAYIIAEVFGVVCHRELFNQCNADGTLKNPKRYEYQANLTCEAAATMQIFSIKKPN